MLLSILLFFNLLVGETYYVIQLKGKIVNVETSQALKAGDKLTPETKLKFTSLDAKAILISNSRGRFIISGKHVSKPNDSEVTEFVKNVLLSHDKDDYRYMSTRGTTDHVDNAELESYFGVGKFFIVGKSLTLKINNEKYPLSDSKYFIIKYKSALGMVDKKITGTDGLITIDKEHLYNINGKPIIPESIKKMDLYFYDATTKYEDYITSFNPVFVSESQLDTEMNVQIQLFKSLNLTKEETKTELQSYFSYAYGPTDAPTLDAVIEKKLGAY